MKHSRFHGGLVGELPRHLLIDYDANKHKSDDETTQDNT